MEKQIEIFFLNPFFSLPRKKSAYYKNILFYCLDQLKGPALPVEEQIEKKSICLAYNTPDQP